MARIVTKKTLAKRIKALEAHLSIVSAIRDQVVNQEARLKIAESDVAELKRTPRAG
jgi:hypothetical protein